MRGNPSPGVLSARITAAAFAACVAMAPAVLIMPSHEVLGTALLFLCPTVAGGWVAMSLVAYDLTFPVALFVGPAMVLRATWKLVTPRSYLQRVSAEAREHLLPTRWDDKAATGGEVSLTGGAIEATSWSTDGPAWGTGTIKDDGDE